MTVTRVAWGRLDNLSTAVLRELVENRREELVCSDLACEVRSMIAGYPGGKMWRWIEDTRCALGRVQ